MGKVVIKIKLDAKGEAQEAHLVPAIRPGNAVTDRYGPDWEDPWDTGNPQVRGEPAVGWLPRSGFVSQEILTPKMAAARMGCDLDKDAQAFYDKVLEETDDWNCWGVHELFPDANGHQALAAAEYIIGQMRENYAEQYEPEWWFMLEGRLRSMVFAGLT